MGTYPRDSEGRAFRIFWDWLTKKKLTDIELDKMRNRKDPPDVCFLLDEKRIAMEHTRVFRRKQVGSSKSNPLRSPHRDLVIQGRICDNLEEFLREASGGMPPVHVFITFTSCHEVKKPQEKTIARGVLDLIFKRWTDGRSLPIELHRTRLKHISSCLAEVLVVPGGASSRVIRHARGPVDESGLRHFEAAAVKKGADLARYEKEFDECWLLLSAGGSHPDFWFDPSLSSPAIRCQFSRVFFVDESRGRVYEIPVAGVEFPAK
ncbi:MAG: hypothetical protein ABSH08_05135 [Tepidisphaeraceae bacterium]|jgi:hypothetical protein